MTEEEIKSNDNIPTADIEDDIATTRHEIEQYENELRVLRNNPQDNRVQIYFREGKIKTRQDFVDKLKEILDYRRNEELKK